MKMMTQVEEGEEKKKEEKEEEEEEENKKKMGRVMLGLFTHYVLCL
jgi:ribosomal protein L12E/L44/L45/RPP1/RPP2